MRKLVLTAALCAAPIANAATGAVVYVNHAAGAGGDGTSWVEAFVDLEVALLAAGTGDEIWIAAGTYLPGSTDGFQVSDPIALYGGFAGNEASPAERDLEANETILSGDLEGDDGSAWTNRSDNAEPVVNITTASLVVIDGCVIERGGVDPNHPGWGGGVVVPTAGDIALRNCRLSENQAWLGGGLFAMDIQTMIVEDCAFTYNRVGGGGGAAWCNGVQYGSFERTVFTGNESNGMAGGMNFQGLDVYFRDCVFTFNSAGDNAGGLGITCYGLSTLINCVFSRNEGWFHGAGLLLELDHEIVNCTFSENVGVEALYIGHPSTTGTVSNTIVWGNDTTIWVEPAADCEIRSSCIEGGWPGAGNIDDDPLFVQPGTGDVRLAEGSPCLDAGDSESVPRGVTTDLAGAPRIQGAAVDMGAYEGAFDALPVAASDGLDQGEAVLLVPSGGSPVTSAFALIQNLSGGDNATVTLTEVENAHSGAGGYSESSNMLLFSTTLPDGTHFSRMYIHFTEADLDGADPLDMNLTRFAETTGTFALAVSANTVNSPGHSSPIGDRYVTSGIVIPLPSSDLGDYGVQWNDVARMGIAWANVDRAGDFGVGLPTCATDCAQPPDEVTGWADFVAVLVGWGPANGPFDVDGDGNVGASDLFGLLIEWGACPP